jgi:hypothetical protein
MINCKGNDSLGSLWHRYPWISDGMAGVGTSGETAPSPERPLSEGLVPSQPAPDGVPLHVVGGDPPRVRTTDCGGGTAGGNDHGPLDDLGCRVDSAEAYRRCIQRFDPANDVGRFTARQPVPHHPPLVLECARKRIGSLFSHQTRPSSMDLGEECFREA